MGCRQAVKVQDFDSCMRWFKSSHPSQSCEFLLSVFSFLNDSILANKAGRPVNPGVAQLVERVVWDHEAAGSNPVTWTILALSQIKKYKYRKEMDL